jgi:hypothetical protein
MLNALVVEMRAQPDSVQWAADLLKQAEISPEDAHFFVVVWNAAGAELGAKILQQGGLPRCSFCLKTSADVRSMITSPNANICNECSEIVQNTFASKEKRSILSWLVKTKRS